MADALDEYRRKRDRNRTGEPWPEGPPVTGNDDKFVIQEHHASRLHWDFRFERDGVLVSWAVPKGLPRTPGVNRLAVHTEDHPMEYLDFEGEIPAGEYGGGLMAIWDRGRYETLHWNDHKVEVVFAGERARGKYVFLNMHDPDSPKDWVLRRLDPAEAGFEDAPVYVEPMPVPPGALPTAAEDGEWRYEFDWSGLRVLVLVSGGRLTVTDEAGADITGRYPELRGLGEQLGSTEVLLDGQIVAFDHGRPSADALRQRNLAYDTAARRLKDHLPVFFFAADVLHLDGESTMDRTYTARRELLDDLELTGARWQAPPVYPGDGEAVLRAAADHGLAGILAKRADSPYTPGEDTGAWRRVPVNT